MIERQDPIFSSGIPMSLASKFPFQVPCPPSAIQLPPPVNRRPPETKGGNMGQIPSPPTGARVPGDRIAWDPLEFPKARIEEAPTTAPEVVLAETTPDYDPHELPLVGTAIENDAEADQVSESSDSEEGVAGILIESTEADSNTEQFREAEANHLGGLGTNEEMEATISLNQIPLAGDSIQIDALADLLGIKSYQVLKDLIGLEIFAKETDLIFADTANEIASTYGFEIIPGRASRGQDNSGEGSDPAASGLRDRITFQTNSGLVVSAGDWIRDSTHGLGRIIKLYSKSEDLDLHRVWFAEQAGEGMIIEGHPLKTGTLGVIDESMVSKDVREAAPEER